MYFGFTHCPDICPDELDKMAKMIDTIKAKRGANVVRPIFVTCDPNRDSPAVVKSYLAEFHPDIVGLTGTWDEVKAMCKAYRVYFSTPPHVQPGQDYLVDHSIYFYLMGSFSPPAIPNLSPEKKPQKSNLLYRKSANLKANIQPLFTPRQTQTATS